MYDHALSLYCPYIVRILYVYFAIVVLVIKLCMCPNNKETNFFRAFKIFDCLGQGWCVFLR